MHATTNPQLGLLDGFMTSTISNDFLEKLERGLDWKPIEAVLQRMYPATTGHPPHPPLVLFKMSLLQHCYGLSDPQCEEMVTADKAYWSRARSEWCGRNGVASGILRKAVRGEKLPASAVRANRLFSSIRCQIEKVFGWWKRSAGYRRVRYVGREPNRLELEFKSICWNLKRLVNLPVA